MLQQIKESSRVLGEEQWRSMAPLKQLMSIIKQFLPLSRVDRLGLAA
jgi:hypothetical protein